MEKFKELSLEEMQEVEGGYWLVLAGVIAVAILTDIAMNTADTIETFQNGFESGYEDAKQ